MSDRRPRAHNSTLRVPAKPMRKVNEDRQRRREEADLVYGTHHEWIKTLPCDLDGRQGHTCRYYDDRPRVEGHHIKHVGSGGEDRNNEVPLCPGGHDEAHALPLTAWCRKYHRDFRSVACDYTNQFDAEHP